MAHRPPGKLQTIPRIALLLFATVVFVTPHNSAAQHEGRAKVNLQGFQQLHTRLATLNVNGISLADYHLAKAHAWLEFSKEEYFDNDRSGIVESTFAEALGLIEQLEAGVMTPLSMSTPLLEGEVRLDLKSWQVVEELKVQKLSCAGNLIARVEVQLVHVEHELHELGPIHAVPYRQAVQRMVEEIKAVDCQPSGQKDMVPLRENSSEAKP
jgi:OmpA-OmpF porin, OOP family